MKDVKSMIAQMSLREKASICSGSDFWHTQGIERLDILPMTISDGSGSHEDSPLSTNSSLVPICYPTAAGVASSFNRKMIYSMGQQIGNECQSAELGILLSPGVNIKRSPLCGRNFKCFSEDPYVAGEMGTSYIQGLQSKNIGACIKHFAVSNQETRRMSASSNVGERPLHEIYLSAFEKPIREGKPWSVMASYSRINGEYASESTWLLTDLLRDTWKFDGFVMTDWSGSNNRVAGLAAGLDLEMPGNGGINDNQIITAVKAGILAESLVDKSVERILTAVYRYKEAADNSSVSSSKNKHQYIKRFAQESMVLLKNDGLLPLEKEQKIAFIGAFAENPRCQGGSGSLIQDNRAFSALKAVQNVAKVIYAKGYITENDCVNETLQAEAIFAAKGADVAVLFMGLPPAFECEGYDRAHLNLPDCQNQLLEEIKKVQKHIVVVLHNGSPITMPWIHDVNAVLESYLAGGFVGEAQIDILFGAVNPSGKLAETFPLQVEDTPSYGNFPGYRDEVNYSEGVFVGYRHYDTRKLNVLFPFGHGLSYTTFEYSNLKMNQQLLSPGNTLEVSVTITNTGIMTGKEIVQLYIKPIDSAISRPEKELKQFDKVELAPGQSKTITMLLDEKSFAFWDEVETHNWRTLSGNYEIMVGKSSRDIILSDFVHWDIPLIAGFRVNTNTLIGDLSSCPVTAPILSQMMKEQLSSLLRALPLAIPNTGNTSALITTMRNMPLYGIRNLVGKAIDEPIKKIIRECNKALEDNEK